MASYFILYFSRDHVLTMLHLAPIFANGNRRVTGGFTTQSDSHGPCLFLG